MNKIFMDAKDKNVVHPIGYVNPVSESCVYADESHTRMMTADELLELGKKNGMIKCDGSGHSDGIYMTIIAVAKRDDGVTHIHAYNPYSANMVVHYSAEYNN